MSRVDMIRISTLQLKLQRLRPKTDPKAQREVVVSMTRSVTFPLHPPVPCYPVQILAHSITPTSTRLLSTFVRASVGKKDGGSFKWLFRESLINDLYP